VSLALDYGKPVIAYSPDPRLTEHYAVGVIRASTLIDVKRFVERHLALDRRSPGEGGR
jgi:hypothetical protein